MTDFREEAYILEKMEITEDDIDDEINYEEIKDEENKEQEESDEDLNNFDMLKAKTEYKQLAKTGGAADSMKTFKMEPKPKTVERDVVIDDYIRNFLQKCNMKKTLNIF